MQVLVDCGDPTLKPLRATALSRARFVLRGWRRQQAARRASRIAPVTA
jgi:hypothetical protein